MEYKPTFLPSRRTMTIPNQGLTVADILSRFTRGQALPLFRQSHDDPQGLSEDEQMNLYECEDDFERRNVLISIDEGVFNEPPKSRSARSTNAKNETDSELVENSVSSVGLNELDDSKNSEN